MQAVEIDTRQSIQINATRYLRKVKKIKNKK